MRTWLMLAVVLGSAACASAEESGLVERGRYLATAADCAACHTDPTGGRPFAGGYAITSPLGPIYATNITPSKTHGIGTYSEATFARALRDGVRGDSAHLYPAMPYTAYAKLTDEDVAALYAFFMQGVAPVDSFVPETRLPFPFNLRASMSIWNAMFLDTRRFRPDVRQSAEWNRGAYLAEALAHCGTCHTPRNVLMAEKADQAYAGAPIGAWFAPNITADWVDGLGGWSGEDIVRYLKLGTVHHKAQAAGPMAEAVSISLQHLSEADLRALAAYIQSVPPRRTSSVDRPAFAWGAPARDEPALRGEVSSPTPGGAVLYSRYCASCHQPGGDGTADGQFPSLLNNTATGRHRPDNLLAAILFGVERNAGGRSVLMPRFDAQSYVQPLTDAQVATVANYVLRTFGDPSVQIGAADVAQARNGGAPVELVKLVSIAPVATGLGGLLIAGVFLARRTRQPRVP